MVKLSSQTSGYGTICAGIDSPNLQLTPLAKICTSPFPSLPIVEKLCISEIRLFKPSWAGDIDVLGTQWLELFHPFASVKDLYVYRRIVPWFVLALLELLERGTTEELPALQNLFLEELQSGNAQKVTEDFVTARKLSGNPITVTHWDRNSEKDNF